jgi:YggT family protein
MISLITLIANMLLLALIVRAVLSWIPSLRGSSFARAVDTITDPIVRPFQRILPTPGGIDFSVMAAFFAVEILQWVLIGLLTGGL